MDKLLNGVIARCRLLQAANQRATKVPIAGAATMLKDGVRSSRCTTNGERAYTPNIKTLA